MDSSAAKRVEIEPVRPPEATAPVAETSKPATETRVNMNTPEELRAHLVTLSKDVHEGKVEQTRAQLKTVRENLEAKIQAIAAKPASEQSDADRTLLTSWEKLRKETGDLETTIDNRVALEGTSTFQTLKKTGALKAMDWATDKLSVVGNGIADVSKTVYYGGLKPLWEKGIKPIWDSIKGIFTKMPGGMKSALASILNFFGAKDLAKKLETTTETETKFAAQLTQIKASVYPAKLELEGDPENNATLIQKLMTANTRLGLYNGDFSVYLENVASQLPRTGDSKITMTELLAAAEKFNKDPKREDDRKKEIELARLKATPPAAALQPAPTPAAPPAAPTKTV
jgi:hypothetical protein